VLDPRRGGFGAVGGRLGPFGSGLGPFDGVFARAGGGEQGRNH